MNDNKKIESFVEEHVENSTIMKPIYSIDKDLMCGVIKYNIKKYYVDFDDYQAIINYPKKFVFMQETDIYPSYSYNAHRINYLQFLYNFRENNVKYIFKNGNNLDLRRCNVDYYHTYHESISNMYSIIEYIPGHFSKNGVDPYYMKNPLWRIKDNNTEVYLMYCEKDTICKLCPISYKKIRDFEIEKNEGKKLTFHYANNCIISSNNLYIQQIIMECYDSIKIDKWSRIHVQHIDNNQLNNVFKNLKKNDIKYPTNEETHLLQHQLNASYNIIEYIPGHYCTIGHDANIIKNPLWRIKDNNKDYILMYCEKETICKLCPVSYKKIIDFENENNNGKKLTWFKLKNGYIMSSCNLYIHQIITGCYGNGKGTKNISVYHIDRNALNNSWENLRISTRKEQEQNSKGIAPGTKRARKTNAKPLPEGITQDMMAKYVCYYHEFLNSEETRSREFFKIEKHPKLNKIWIGTKSNKVSIQEKLNQVNKIIEEIEKDIYPIKPT